MREWLVDYSDDDDDDDESDDESIDILDLPPPDNVTFLPTTIEGLRTCINSHDHYLHIPQHTKYSIRTDFH